MKRALALARASIGMASPNPQVGCVLIREDPARSAATELDHDLVLGEGAHVYDLRDHAEIVALKQAATSGSDVRGATAYVTLEPCSHQGRTGPCADALIAAGITRCVVATQDPNPLVSGQGLARLRAAGVAVTLGVCEEEARSLNLAFASFVQHRRPFVTLKAALSADGYLAPAPETRARTTPFWLTGAAARAEVHRMRHAADAILSGIGTVLADDPALTDRSGHPRRRSLLRVILDPGLRLPIKSHLIRGAMQGPSDATPDLLLLCAEAAEPSRQRMLEAAAPRKLEVRRVAAGPGGRLSLPAVLQLLAERTCLSLLLEGGSALNSAFLHEDLVDQVALFFAETELGSGSLPFAATGPSPFLLRQRLLRPSSTSFGKDVLTIGLLHDPWPPQP